jgi:hypothetical protein
VDLVKNQSLPKTIVFTGRLDGKQVVREVKVEQVRHDAGYLPRQWAKLEIDRLLAEDAEKNKARIIKLSLASYVMTPYTSLLVLETDADYAKYQVDRGRKDHWAMYACPERVPLVYEPHGTQSKQAPTSGKGDVQEVLDTIVVRVPPQMLEYARQAQATWPSAVTVGQLYEGSCMVPVDVTATNGSQQTLNSYPKLTYVLPGMPQTPYGTPKPVSPYMNLLGQNPATNYYPMVKPEKEPSPQPGSSKEGSGPVTAMPQPPASTPAVGPVVPVQPAGFPGPMPQPVPPPAVTSGTVPSLPPPMEKPPLELAVGGPGNPYGAVKIISAKDIDPRIIQQAMDAVQGKKPPGFGPGGGQFPGGGFRPAGHGGGGFFPGGGGGSRPGGFGPGGGSFGSGSTGSGGIGGKPSSAKNGQFHPYYSSSLATGLGGNLMLQPSQSFGTDKYQGQAKEGKDFKQPVVATKLPELGVIVIRSHDDCCPADGTLDEWLMTSSQPAALLYDRPTFRDDARVFGDLVWYAPGLNTIDADICAVLEAEARPDPGQRQGRVDPEARKLLEQARTAGWLRLTVPADGGAASYVVYCNGAGQFSWDRVLPCGLREQVYCDGKTLWHLYPEIGLGSKRPFSRFHFAVIGNLVPWLVPAADDLAHSADVLFVEKGVVAVQARAVDKLRDADGQPVPYVRMHLVFGADGRLVERRLVQMPGKQLLARQCYDADGTVRNLDVSSDKVVSQSRWQVAAAAVTPLMPQTSHLVVVPMPLRTRQHLEKIRPHLGKLDDDGAIALLAGLCAEPQGLQQATQLFAARFHSRGDRRLGFYVLLASAGAVLDPGEPYPAKTNGKPCFFDVVGEHPDEPLAMYLAYHFDTQRKGTQTALGELGGPPAGFVQRLAAFRDLYVQWKSGRAMQGDAKQRLKERERTLQFVGKSPLPIFDWALLMAVYHGSSSTDFDLTTAIIEASKALGEDSSLGYATHYEIAKGFWQAGHAKAAQQYFAALYQETLERGILPPVDMAFKECLRTGAYGPSYAELMAEAAGVLAKRGQALRILALAQQAQLLGDERVVDDMLSRALAACRDKRESSMVQLAVVQQLVKAGQFVRADAMLQLVLAEEPFKQSPALWRLAASLAGQRNLTARSVACLDQALELEFRDLPPVINLQTARSDYARLLEQYQQVANAVAILDREPSKDFIAKVVRAADRWRSLDPDAADVCRLTARILLTVGASDLAWDYMTTPVGLRPNEAAPWLQVAEGLRGEGLFELADRAYTLAFEAEPTNAQILWDRAQNLFQAGRVDDGLAVYRVLAAGSWQQRFQGLQAEAKQRLKQ